MTGASVITALSFWACTPTGTETVFTGVIGAATTTTLYLQSFNSDSQEFIVDDLSVKRIIY